MADYNNGSVTVTVTGGQPLFTYTLKELQGSNYVIVPNDEYSSDAWQNPVTVSSRTYTFGNNLGPDQNTDIDVTGIRPGTYRVHIEDAGGCEIETADIVVNEFTVGGSNACVTFETVTPPEAPNAWNLEPTAPTTSANNDGNIRAYVPTINYNGGFNDSEITVTATLAGGASFNLPATGTETSNSYSFLDNPPQLVPGTYTVVATVPSEGCTRSLGTVEIPSFAVQAINITGVTITSGGSTVSPSALVSGTQYTVTVNSTSSNLDGAPQFALSVIGTSNYTVSPAGYSTNNVFTLTINATGSFNLSAAAQDNADFTPGDIYTQSITVTSSLSAFNCANAMLSVSDGTVGDAVVASVGGGATINSISPAVYVEGTQTYTALITVPSGYSNSGAQISCTDTATGTAVSAGTTLYYFHGGVNAWPYASDDMTKPGVNYYIPSGGDGTQTAVTATFDQAMAYILDRAETQIQDPYSSGAPYTVRELNMPAGATLLDDGTEDNTSWTFDAVAIKDRYYLAVPSSVTGFDTDLTSGSYMINSGGAATSAVEKKEFTYNGEAWTLYKMGAASSVLTLNYGLNN